MKSTTAEYIAPCFPPAEPPAHPMDLDDRFDRAQEDLANTMARAIQEWGVEAVLSVIESLEGVRVFFAPELSPEEKDPEAIAECYAQARVAMKQVIDYQSHLLESTQSAMLQCFAATLSKTIETTCAKVSIRLVTRCLTEDFTQAQARAKKAKAAALESSRGYQEAVARVKEIEMRDGEKVPQVVVTLFEEV